MTVLANLGLLLQNLFKVPPIFAAFLRQRTFTFLCLLRLRASDKLGIPIMMAEQYVRSDVV